MSSVRIAGGVGGGWTPPVIFSTPPVIALCRPRGGQVQPPQNRSQWWLFFPMMSQHKLSYYIVEIRTQGAAVSLWFRLCQSNIKIRKRLGLMHRFSRCSANSLNSPQCRIWLISLKTISGFIQSRSPSILHRLQEEQSKVWLLPSIQSFK
jgi:hypothetical protein